MRWRDRTVIDGILGIDVCKNTLDVSISSYTKVRTKSFTNSPDGWRHLLDWLIAQKIQRVHACCMSCIPPSPFLNRHGLDVRCAVNHDPIAPLPHFPHPSSSPRFPPAPSAFFIFTH